MVVVSMGKFSTPLVLITNQVYNQLKVTIMPWDSGVCDMTNQSIIVYSLISLEHIQLH